MGLNEDLVIGREERRHGYGTVVLDDCNFHESANMEQFEKERSLSIMAPDGEVCSPAIQTSYVLQDLAILERGG